MENFKVVIIDIQPIDPPIGGGRLRLLGLYSGFLNGIAATYIGSYDWRGPKNRTHQLSECLTEINVPLSEEHFKAHDLLASELGKNCIDTAFPLQGYLSTEYIQAVRSLAQDAQIVIFSHPWVFPLVADILDTQKQLLIYDSQNFEGGLRTQLYDNGTKVADNLCREAVRCEWEMCTAADMILSCSEEDKKKFSSIYKINPLKAEIVRNGVFTKQIFPCTFEEKERLKKALSLTGPVVCFIGSDYYPNEEAAWLIIETANLLPQITFIIIGGVGEKIKNGTEPPNVLITGFVDEKEKIDYLHVSDIAINPMLSGSGTNIKMFDFMAAGLPIITTDIGARGIKNTANSVYVLCEKSVTSLKRELLHLLGNDELRNTLSINCRKEALEKYNWNQISYELGYVLVQRYKKKTQGSPFFSIVIPTYERPDLLFKLLENIRKQTCSDFEVIIIDQSSNKFEHLSLFEDLKILYFKTDIKGAAKARNTGIKMANGFITAFIDDDCIPDNNWLYNAKKHFDTKEIVGVEGLIKADIYDSKNYRVVSNVGFEGIGFMTANLFVKTDILREIGGFDEEFDNPHFREDTDLGWRVLDYGHILYAKDVEVLHSSHLRITKRESIDERNKFFVHDPLLLKKHPQKFLELFWAEGHYKEAAYWKYFKQGVLRHNMVSNDLNPLLEDARSKAPEIAEHIQKIKSTL